MHKFTDKVLEISSRFFLSFFLFFLFFFFLPLTRPKCNETRAFNELLIPYIAFFSNISFDAKANEKENEEKGIILDEYGARIE